MAAALYEDELQRAVAKLFVAVLLPSVIYFHTPNGEKRSPITAARLKGMGVRPGVPDCYLAWTDFRGVQHTGWIELKSKTGHLEDVQKDFRNQAEALGHHWALARSIDDVLAAIKAWGVPSRVI